MRYLIPLLFAVFCWLSPAQAQQTFPVNGVEDSREGLYAFTRATIYKSYNEKIENATLLIRKGKVEAVGERVRIPKEAVVIDLQGKYIYPSFIEMYSGYGMPEIKKGGGGNWWLRQQQMTSNKKGAFSWNQAMQTEFSAHEHFKVANKKAEGLRKLGFGAVLSHMMDGISRGTSSLVALGDERAHKVLLKEEVAHHLSFKKGTSTQTYPTSLMGGIALLRQTYLDGMWYENYGYKEERNNSLVAWNAVQSLPQIFEVTNKLEVLRAHKIAKEFDKKYIFIGKGDEYQRLADMKATNAAFIIPVEYPKAFDVEDPYDAMEVTLGDMKHWELAPTNAGRLAEANIDIAFTTHHLKKKEDFLGNIRKAIENGLSEEAALKALTATPARLMKVEKMLGDLNVGKYANFLITSKPIFDKDTKIHHNWVLGKPHVLSALEVSDLTGDYELTVGDSTYNLAVTGEAPKSKMKIIVNDSTKIDVKYSHQNGVISLSFLPKDASEKLRLSGVAGEDGWKGKGQLGNGRWTDWKVTPKAAAAKAESENKEKKDKEKKKEEEKASEIGAVAYPFLAYGWTEKPVAEKVLFKNATVWTNEQEGIVENTDVLIADGKIVKIGKGIAAKNATVVDAEGKHLTSGIIDEHSHIAIARGVNECSQVSTAEVRIGDVINSDDVNIYRQLAGGVTTAQLLHGSCNPIGGQAALIKLRWGYAPEAMKYEGADGFIKFALGENVKKSRSNNNNRFPDTRMGVEQVYRDYFSQAKEYDRKQKAGDPSLRRDLDLETVAEILNEKRFITCHSYVQSEINMLMHVADDMGFKVNTFTHILEGYKVADKMAKHGAGGSSFSDWWAYKYEVIDAIPQNAKIMSDQGVTVAFNSDDAEMARRLNQEAAKAVMYSDMSEEEAWKLVTLNPAKLLHVDDKVGSIKAGKQADVVLWSANPLSIYAKAEMTFVDGIKFFDKDTDKEHRRAIQKERARLIQKMLNAKKNGAAMQGVKGKHHHHYHCDDHEDEMK